MDPKLLISLRCLAGGFVAAGLFLAGHNIKKGKDSSLALKGSAVFMVFFTAL
jgi:hypothetical protein